MKRLLTVWSTVFALWLPVLAFYEACRFVAGCVNIYTFPVAIVLSLALVVAYVVFAAAVSVALVWTLSGCSGPFDELGSILLGPVQGEEQANDRHQ